MLELNMASTSGADDGATVAMLRASAPTRPGATLAVGRDATRCHLVTPADWLFVSRMHLQFRCGDDLRWSVEWLRGSQQAPVADVVVDSGEEQMLPYGGAVTLPPRSAGEVVIRDLGGQRRVCVTFFLAEG